MKLLRLFRIIPACILLLAARAEPPADPAGHWEGEIVIPTAPLAIRVDLERTGDAWSGTIDIPVQGLRGHKLQPLKVDGTAVHFTLSNVPGAPTFAGLWDKEGARIAGDFTQNGLKFPFKLERRAHRALATGETPAKGLPGEGLAGHWQASLKPVPVMELRLALEITKSSGGTYEGVMISLDQGSARIPISSLTESSGKYTLQAASVGGMFEGQLSADGSEFAGEWRQGGQKHPLVFKRLAKAAALHRPQDPRKPYPYTEEEVTVDHAAAGIKLAGTLTLPSGAGPHPAVLLLTGSGPQDRDEALMGHRPFLVLADHLTRAGIAVLRCDDRGVGRSTGKFGQATVDDFVEDALAGVAWLKTRPEIDPQRIGLLGHSEGGYVAPLAAVKNPESIAFIVLLAGIGVPVEDLLIRQGADLQRVAGASETDIAKNTAAQREIFAMLKQTSDPAATVKQRAREIMTRQMADYTSEQRQALGFSEALPANQSKMIASPWFRKLVASDPREAFRQVKCPVLAINGEKDLQVSPKENLGGIREALAAGGNTQVKIAELPGLNHLFQTCTTGSVGEYGQIEETMAPAALDLISDWLRENTRP